MSKNLHERAFIELLRATPKRRSSFLRLGLGDDAAILRTTPTFESLLTCDLLVEGVHFDLKTIRPRELGAKALAASLSDIAAMGGLPRVYLVSLAIPRRATLSPAFFQVLYSGMRAQAKEFGVELAGGDTTSSPGPLMIDIFLLGEAKKGTALRRSGAKPGDFIFCTGHLGDSAAGLMCLKRQKPLPRGGTLSKSVAKTAADFLIHRHRLPTPRCREGYFLAQARLVSACIDVSDGLASELHHLSRESGVSMEVEAKKIPLSAAATMTAAMLGKDPLEWALTGGEDYELLFTVPPSKVKQLELEFRRKRGCSFSCIGRVTRGRGVRLLRGATWKALPDIGYEHKIF